MNTRQPQHHIITSPQGAPIGVITLIDPDRYPALGGCRILYTEYTPEIIEECTALANTMHLKARIHNLPLTGGKSILCIPPKHSTQEYLKPFISYLKKLNGKYITAIDIGSTSNEMDQIAEATPYVTCHQKAGGDPSKYTARTVILSIKAACQHLYGNASLQGKKLVIQGTGKVGVELIKQLQSEKVEITATDIDPEKLKQCQQQYHINIVSPDDIFTPPCDIFIPCATSKILTPASIQQLQTKIIASAANNSLQDTSMLPLIQAKNILYLPDFLINAGGLICCAHQYFGNFDLDEKINQVYDLTLKLLSQHDSDFYTHCLETAMCE